MKIIFKFTISTLLFFLSFFSISCDSGVTDSKSGIISVSVVDNDPNQTPVPNVTITLTPINIVQKTDSSGISNFEVAPGNYFVDAEVCCQGPGNIKYHVPVQVIENKTADVKLTACLSCE